jgi:hypothetical protein
MDSGGVSLNGEYQYLTVYDTPSTAGVSLSGDYQSLTVYNTPSTASGSLDGGYEYLTVYDIPSTALSLRTSTTGFTASQATHRANVDIGVPAAITKRHVEAQAVLMKSNIADTEQIEAEIGDSGDASGQEIAESLGIFQNLGHLASTMTEQCRKTTMFKCLVGFELSFLMACLFALVMVDRHTKKREAREQAEAEEASKAEKGDVVPQPART